MMDQVATKPHGGLPLAFGAYLIWGFLPLYLRFVHWVPPFEFVGWRIIFTLPLCAMFLLWRGETVKVLAALRQPRTMALLTLSSLLIAVNWVVYIVAIQSGHVFAASLGYYINPLVNVLAGTALLGERLSTRQWIAVALAAAGVSLLAWDARAMLFISLTLAVSFATYGLVRKLVAVESLPGLTIESIILLIPASLTAWYFAQGPAGSAITHDASAAPLLILGGVLTAVPLLLFAAAARRMDYSTLGMVQFVAPTIVFLLGVFLFGEPLRQVQLACFVLIWCAIAVFVWDILAQRRARLRVEAPA
jgi:chloramphenicol-sensitive protein RarD